MSWDVRDRTVMVTGGSGGIGLEASVQLAARGARVVLVGRDATRTESARTAVAARSGSAAVTSMLCDFSSQAGIRALAADFRAEHGRLDVLVNNAGGVNRRRRVTEDGIEATFAVNHLGYFLLTNLLLDLLVAAAPARIVSVASAGHRRGSLDFDDLGYRRGYSIMKAYSRSKLCNILMTAELARRLEGTGVTANCVHPGNVDTGIWSGAPRWAVPVIDLFFRRTFISAEEGAAHVCRLVLDPVFDGRSGLYVEMGAPVAPSAAARDRDAAGRLWDVSAELVGL